MLLNEQEWEKAWSVTFKPVAGGRLHLKYPDGEERVFDVWNWMKRTGRTKGFWKNLFDQDYFNSVTVVGRAVPSWDDDLITLAPELLFTDSDPIN